MMQTVNEKTSALSSRPRRGAAVAHRLLVDWQMNPRVVMQVGGWDSFQAIEPYLNAPTPEVVNDAFEDAGLT
jgi:hypothetical protein